MDERLEVVDRYGGGPRPDPRTMCAGQCEGLGCYPVKKGDFDSPVEEHLWQQAHEAGEGHEGGRCDGYHFIKCPDCGGTGKAPQAAEGRHAQ